MQALNHMPYLVIIPVKGRRDTRDFRHAVVTYYSYDCRVVRDFSVDVSAIGHPAGQVPWTAIAVFVKNDREALNN